MRLSALCHAMPASSPLPPSSIVHPAHLGTKGSSWGVKHRSINLKSTVSYILTKKCDKRAVLKGTNTDFWEFLITKKSEAGRVSQHVSESSRFYARGAYSNRSFSNFLSFSLCLSRFVLSSLTNEEITLSGNSYKILTIFRNWLISMTTCGLL